MRPARCRFALEAVVSTVAREMLALDDTHGAARDGRRPVHLPPGARTAFGRGALAKGRRAGLAREALTVANRTSRGRTVWVEVRRARGRALSGDYRLDLARA